LEQQFDYGRITHLVGHSQLQPLVFTLRQYPRPTVLASRWNKPLGWIALDQLGLEQVAEEGTRRGILAPAAVTVEAPVIELGQVVLQVIALDPTG